MCSLSIDRLFVFAVVLYCCTVEHLLRRLCQHFTMFHSYLCQPSLYTEVLSEELLKNKEYTHTKWICTLCSVAMSALTVSLMNVQCTMCIRQKSNLEAIYQISLL